MTTVRVSLRTPDASGVDAPAVGRLDFTPTRRRTVDDSIVLPTPFEAALVDGVATVDLAPTGPGWCWRVVERVPRGTSRYVLVPEVGPVGYEDLTDVDPATLDPSVAPESAWWAALGQVTEAGVGLTPGAAITVPATQPWVTITTEDDGTPSSGWPDRLAFLFRAVGGTARKIFSLNEYCEPRINARTSTVALRVFEREYPTDPAHSAAVPLMEVQDDRTTRTSRWSVLTGGRTVQAGDATIGGRVTATNLPAGFLTLGPTESVPGSTPAGTWILRRGA